MCCHIYIYIIFIIIVVSWFLLVFVLLSFVVLVFFWVVVSHRLGSCSFVLVLSLYVWSIGFSGGYSIQYLLYIFTRHGPEVLLNVKEEEVNELYDFIIITFCYMIHESGPDETNQKERERKRKTKKILVFYVVMWWWWWWGSIIWFFELSWFSVLHF